MKTLIIIQARMGSSRLPGKVLMPLGQSKVLDYVITRCRQVINISDVIVATSTLDGDTPIAKWCDENNITYFRGSEDDVLSRYMEAAKPYQPDYVIRVTADCPFVDYEMANELVEKMKLHPVDYIKVEQENLPRGLVVEMFSFKALTYIDENGKEPYHREHVTYYGYEHEEEFTHSTYTPAEQLQDPSLRITLDTEEDYQVCSKVAEHFEGDKLVSSKMVIKYLQEHPEIAKLNAHIEQKAVK
ncbi:cytidylyltransferase domain-containing protein [Bacillus sp. AK128]